MKDRTPILGPTRSRTGAVAASATLLLFSGTLEGQDPPGELKATVSLVEELRIGDLLDGRDQFGRVAAVTVVPSGAFWVLDGQSLTIRRYDENGQLIGEVGGSGDGPGEFRSIWGSGRLRDGSVAVWDPAAGRVSVFEPDGRYVRSFRVAGGMITERQVFQTDTLDRVWMLGGPLASQRWMVYDVGGSKEGEIGDPPHDPHDPRGARWTIQRYGASPMPPFSDRTIAAPSPCGYLVTGRTGTYVLQKRTIDGTQRLVARSWDSVSVVSEERRAFQSREDLYASRRGERPGRVPSLKPAFWALWVDQSCRVWVSRHTTASHVPEAPEEGARPELGLPPLEWWEDRVFDLLGPDGRLAAVVRLPNRHADLAFSEGSTLWVVEYGDYGEQYVVRYRMEPS